MNDALHILGVLVITAVMAFSLTGKSPREVISRVIEQNQNKTQESENSSPLLARLEGYVPPAWIGQNTTVTTNTNTVIDARNETNSGTVLVSNTGAKKERSNFKNSATNDTDNGAIIIAAKNTPRTSLTASVTQANISHINNGNMSYELLLLVVIMLIILVFLVHLVGRKKKRLNYNHSYLRTYPRGGAVNVNHRPVSQQYRYR